MPCVTPMSRKIILLIYIGLIYSVLCCFFHLKCHGKNLNVLFSFNNFQKSQIKNYENSST